MRTLILLTLFIIGCTSPPPIICDYGNEVKLSSSINWVLIDGVKLDSTTSGFSFPYELKGDGFIWEGVTDPYNYKPITSDLNNYLSSGTADVYVNGEGNIVFNILGVTDGTLPELFNISTNNETTDADFFETCY